MSFRFAALLKVMLLTALVGLAGPGSGPEEAAAQECSFLMEDGTKRACTFTENYGQCLYFAYQSYMHCQDPTEDAWTSWFVCEIAYQVDNLACTLEMIGDAIGLLNPF